MATVLACGTAFGAAATAQAAGSTPDLRAVTASDTGSYKADSTASSTPDGQRRYRAYYYQKQDCMRAGRQGVRDRKWNYYSCEYRMNRYDHMYYWYLYTY
ncbi:hypothetical protein [Streptomyces minutiscleroticus]|uniref:hypothetical protein n=1 Tax=Streptomyces minutiscleroticus TaxID=68238 RepID=UPI00167E8D22|nr:hypothetical protein [Streptomyces minutiscleroticus]